MLYCPRCLREYNFELSFKLIDFRNHPLLDFRNAIIRNYSPVIMWGCITETFVIPCMYTALAMVNYDRIPHYLRPHFPSVLWPGDVTDPERIVFAVVAKTISLIALLLFFGIQNPVVGVALLLSLLVNCYMWKALIGRCMLYRYPEEVALSESQMLTARAKEVETHDLEIAVEDMDKLVSYCISMTVLIISFPWALFVLDMAIDFDVFASLWMPIVLISLSVLFVYVSNRFMNLLARSCEGLRQYDSSVILEMTVSPLPKSVSQL